MMIDPASSSWSSHAGNSLDQNTIRSIHTIGQPHCTFSYVALDH